MTPGTTRSEMASLRGGTGGYLMDPIHTFVRHFGRARYEDLSAKVVETVKMTILDTMGAALAGSASDAGRGIAQIAKAAAEDKAAWMGRASLPWWIPSSSRECASRASRAVSCSATCEARSRTWGSRMSI